MAASYPGSVKTFTTKNNGDTAQASHIDDLQDEVNAIETDIITSGLTLTSGKIKFPATQVPSAGANDLDDYEEGSWTPTVGSSGGGTPTYSAQVGRYVKIGKVVLIQGRVTLATLGSLAAGNVFIAGLPATTENVTGLNAIIEVNLWQNLGTAMQDIKAIAQPNTGAIDLYGLTGAVTNSVVTLTVANITGTLDLSFGGLYRATA